MNFELTSEQVQVRDTVRRLMADRYDNARRNGYLAQEPGWSPDVWRSYAQLGLSALLVPTDFGGLGGDVTDQYVVMRELGRAAVLEPYLASCIASATAIARGGSHLQRATFLPGIASGELVFAWAHDHGGSGDTKVRAEPSRTGWRLSGTRRLVLHGAAAGFLIVSAQAPEDTGLFVVESKAPGLALRPYRLVDGSSAVDVRLEAVPADPLGPQDVPAGDEVILHTEKTCIAAICAEAVGSMQGALDLTIAHLNARTQFGKPLASNQALRHRCADMAVLLECAESMAMLAAISMRDPEACQPGDLHAAGMVVSRYARELCEHAVQLHGGIGMTEEYGVGRYLQRAMVLEQLFGDTLRRIAGSGSPDVMTNRPHSGLTPGEHS